MATRILMAMATVMAMVKLTETLTGTLKARAMMILSGDAGVGNPPARRRPPGQARNLVSGTSRGQNDTQTSRSLLQTTVYR